MSEALTILPNPESSSTSGRRGLRSPPVHSWDFPVWPFRQLPVDINNALALSLQLKNADGFQLQGNMLAYKLLLSVSWEPWPLTPTPPRDRGVGGGRKRGSCRRQAWATCLQDLSPPFPSCLLPLVSLIWHPSWTLMCETDFRGCLLDQGIRS